MDNITRNRYEAAYRLMRVRNSTSPRVTEDDKSQAAFMLVGLASRAPQHIENAVKSYNSRWMWDQADPYKRLRHKYQFNRYQSLIEEFDITNIRARADWQAREDEEREWEYRTEKAAEQAAEDYYENRGEPDYQDYLDSQLDLYGGGYPADDYYDDNGEGTVYDEDPRDPQWLAEIRDDGLYGASGDDEYDVPPHDETGLAHHFFDDLSELSCPQCGGDHLKDKHPLAEAEGYHDAWTCLQCGYVFRALSRERDEYEVMRETDEARYEAEVADAEREWDNRIAAAEEAEIAEYLTHEQLFGTPPDPAITDDDDIPF